MKNKAQRATGHRPFCPQIPKKKSRKGRFMPRVASAMTWAANRDFGET